jgi:hypothetical protein
MIRRVRFANSVKSSDFPDFIYSFPLCISFRCSHVDLRFFMPDTLGRCCFAFAIGRYDDGLMSLVLLGTPICCYSIYLIWGDQCMGVSHVEEI